MDPTASRGLDINPAALRAGLTAEQIRGLTGQQPLAQRLVPLTFDALGRPVQPIQAPAPSQQASIALQAGYAAAAQALAAHQAPPQPNLRDQYSYTALSQVARGGLPQSQLPTHFRR